MATRRLIRSTRNEDTTATPRFQRRGPRAEPAPAAPRAAPETNPSVVPYAIPETGWLHSRMREVSFREYEEHRTKDLVHASDLIRGCMRSRAILDDLKVRPDPRRITLHDRIVFAQGNAIHDSIKGIIGEVAPGELYGGWMCRCKTTRRSMMTLEESIQEGGCPECGSLVDDYQEISLEHEETGLLAHPDAVMLIDLGEGHYAHLVMEIKSMAAAQWRDLGRPLPEHLQQVCLYWYVMKELGYVMTEQVILAYVSKDWAFSGNPIKEFAIPIGVTTQAPPAVQGLLDEANAYKHYKETGTLPPRTLCQSPGDTRAKGCQVCQICFALQPAPGARN